MNVTPPFKPLVTRYNTTEKSVLTFGLRKEGSGSRHLLSNTIYESKGSLGEGVLKTKSD